MSVWLGYAGLNNGVAKPAKRTNDKIFKSIVFINMDFIPLTTKINGIMFQSIRVFSLRMMSPLIMPTTNPPIMSEG